MRRIQYIFLILLVSCLFFQTCTARSGLPDRIDREPAVAGRFYPASPAELNNMLETLFSNAEKKNFSDPLAVIVPHAGYVFSGEVAASAFQLIDRDKKYKHVFLIGSSHTMYFNGASIYTQGNFKTPLGSVVVDELAVQLVKDNNFITNDRAPHITEHSLEVQLPFLQFWLKNSFTIVPIIIGGDSESNCKKLADVLAPYLTAENLFVISTDFSHYPGYDDASLSDRNMADAIVKNSTNNFIQTRKDCETKGISGLVTAMCGWTSVYTLLNITENRNDLCYEKISYMNSGDSPYGEKNRVVGYYALALLHKHTGHTAVSEFQLDDSDKVYLLNLARTTLNHYFSDEAGNEPVQDYVPDNLQISAGAFVTLKIDGKLRGCIGNFTSENPLYETVRQMAIAAATNDPRFSPVTKEELKQIEIVISVLTPLKKINSIEEFELGRHGIYIKLGNRTGTFLPQVAKETGWTEEEFLGHCSRDKAGIGWDGWKIAELFTYEALVFSEHDFPKNQ